MTYDLVAKSVKIAALAHEGQKDLGGLPYILHPMRVAIAVAEQGWGPEVVAAAVLHDVVEDTFVELSDLRGSMPEDTVRYVDALTHRKNESWSEYADRIIAVGAPAIAIKLADMTDNVSEKRVEQIPDPEHRARIKAKYPQRIMRLQRALEAIERVG